VVRDKHNHEDNFLLPFVDFQEREKMLRSKCIEAIYPELEDKLVVTIMGACAQELYDLGHCDNFFYLQHAMGLASSIGLGLALNRPDQQVVVLDGDGSVLMNLGTLTTLARYRPRNLTEIIFDNGSLLSTGGFPSHTADSGRTDLAAIAKGAGIPHVAAPTTPFDFVAAVADAFERNDLSVIVARVEAVGPDHFGMDLRLPENAFRFERFIREKTVLPFLSGV
jgi:sulfopyruvate decarboxylase subunit beta